MKNLNLSRSALSVCTAAILFAGCGGSQSPIGAPGALPQTRSLAMLADSGGSWMLPEAKSENLLYFGDNDELTVYSYPQGKFVGVVKNREFDGLQGECVDSSGDIFVTSLTNGKIFEYRHGGKEPIATLQAAANNPSDCAVDPTTGNLAVTTLGSTKPGNLAIYRHARGTPKVYVDPSIQKYFFCGYDGGGNLYLDGQPPKGRFQFAELPKGRSEFTNITLNQKIYWPGSVLWDGNYVAVGDVVVPNVYEFSISGSQGTLRGTTPLDGVIYDNAFSLDRKRIVVAAGGTSFNTAMIFDYPAGGDAVKIIRRGIGGALGLAISTAKTQ
jgi:hypothetical protein